jgi:hypothetical protein
VLRHKRFECGDDVIVVRETSLVLWCEVSECAACQCADNSHLLLHALPVTTNISLLNQVQMKNASRVLSGGVAIPGDIPSETDTRSPCRRLDDGYNQSAATYPIAQPKCSCCTRDTVLYVLQGKRAFETMKEGILAPGLQGAMKKGA